MTLFNHHEQKAKNKRTHHGQASSHHRRGSGKRRIFFALARFRCSVKKIKNQELVFVTISSLTILTRFSGSLRDSWAFATKLVTMFARFTTRLGIVAHHARVLAIFSRSPLKLRQMADSATCAMFL